MELINLYNLQWMLMCNNFIAVYGNQIIIDNKYNILIIALHYYK